MTRAKLSLSVQTPEALVSKNHPADIKIYLWELQFSFTRVGWEGWGWGACALSLFSFVFLVLVSCPLRDVQYPLCT